MEKLLKGGCDHQVNFGKLLNELILVQIPNHLTQF